MMQKAIKPNEQEGDFFLKKRRTGIYDYLTFELPSQSKARATKTHSACGSALVFEREARLIFPMIPTRIGRVLVQDPRVV
jgi:hypothetical protein